MQNAPTDVPSRYPWLCLATCPNCTDPTALVRQSARPNNAPGKFIPVVTDAYAFSFGYKTSRWSTCFPSHSLVCANEFYLCFACRLARRRTNSTIELLNSPKEIEVANLPPPVLRPGVSRTRTRLWWLEDRCINGGVCIVLHKFSGITSSFGGFLANFETTWRYVACSGS